MADDLDLERLAALVAGLAGDVPSGVLRVVADDLAALPPGSGPGAWRSVVARVASPGAREKIAKLMAVWIDHGAHLPPAAVALALQTAAAASERQRSEQNLELVWTGPAPPGNRLRRSDQVLLDLIQGSQKDLLIVTYALYKSPAVWQALEAAVGRGVELVIVPDVDEQHEHDPAAHLRQRLGPTIFEAAEIYLWPPDKRRQPDTHARGVLHAKCAIADSQVMFLSSANLTDYALELNMELGVMVRGGELPAGVAGHFEGLIKAGELVCLE